MPDDVKSGPVDIEGALVHAKDLEQQLKYSDAFAAYVNGARMLVAAINLSSGDSRGLKSRAESLVNVHLPKIKRAKDVKEPQMEHDIRPLSDCDIGGDILQNNLDNCAVVSALICIENLMESQREQDVSGYLGLRPFLPGLYEKDLFVDGTWFSVVFTDKIPVREDGDPVCITSKQKWPILLEKSLYAALGSYTAEISSSCIALSALLGWIPERIPLDSASLMHQSKWALLAPALAKGDCLISLGVSSMSQVEYTPKRFGGVDLIPGHSYAVLDMSTHQSITLRNPWIPECITGLWDEIASSFESIYVNWNPKCFRYMNELPFSIDGHQNETSMSRQHFVLSAETVPTEDILLLLTAKTGRIGSSFGFSCICKGHSLGSSIELTDAPFFLLRLRPSDFVRCKSNISVYWHPDDAWRKQKCPFALSAYGHTPMHLSQCTSKTLTHPQVVHGRWCMRTNGESMHKSKHFYKNPQYLLQIQSRGDLEVFLTQEESLVNIVLISVPMDSEKRLVNFNIKDIKWSRPLYTKGISMISAENIPPGSYILVASALEALGKSFSINCVSSTPFSLRELPSEDHGLFADHVVVRASSWSRESVEVFIRTGGDSGELALRGIPDGEFPWPLGVAIYVGEDLLFERNATKGVSGCASQRVRVGPNAVVRAVFTGAPCDMDLLVYSASRPQSICVNRVE